VELNARLGLSANHRDSGQRQEFHAAAAAIREQLEKAAYPEDAKSFSELMTCRQPGLRGSVRAHEPGDGSIVTQMRDRMRRWISAWRAPTSTDPVTGLINRRELERQIEAHKIARAKFLPAAVQLSGPLGEQVLRTAAQ